MTMTESTTDDPAVPSSAEYFLRIPLDKLRIHAKNPRKHPGDVTELARSIKDHGVLESLLVTPGDDGVFLVATGSRRMAAATQAGEVDVPALVRPLTDAQVIVVGLSENANRTDLNLSEQVAAIKDLMSIEGGLTPGKLCRRIGRSQAWVRDRMAVTILPEPWRNALDTGDLTLAAGAAAASVADLGPEHIDTVCEMLAQSSWREPSQVVLGYRDRLRREANHDEALAKARTKFAVVYTDDEPAPASAKRVGELFDLDGCKAHADEPCHAVVFRRTTWGDGYDQYGVCIDPRRHSPAKVGTANGSDLASERPAARPSVGGGDDSHARRKARLGRIGYTAEVFARRRGGISQTELNRLALTALVHKAGQDALKFAATILDLGLDPAEVRPSRLLDGVDSHAALVRVAGAVALGQAEDAMYHWSNSPQCRAYLATLVRMGYEPDDWTRAVLDQHAADEDGDEPGCDGEDDDADDEHVDDEDEPEVDDYDLVA